MVLLTRMIFRRMFWDMTAGHCNGFSYLFLIYLGKP